MRCLKALLFGALATGALANPVAETLWVDSSDQVRLRVLSQGAGEAIVFVPGWTMTAEIWEGQFEAFSGKFRVLSFDPRGQGRSSKPPHGYDSRRRAKDIHALLLQLNLDRAVLVGWSLGAIDVVNYLQLFGAERVRGVVAVDNSVDRHFSSGPRGQRLLEQVKAQPFEDVLRGFVPGIFGSPVSEARLSQLRDLSSLTPAFAAREALAKASSGEGMVAALKGAKIPGLYAVTHAFAEEGRRMKEALPGQLSLEIFDKAGHALFVDERAHFNQALESFISRLP